MADLVTLDCLFIDGTKIEANANQYDLKTYKTFEELFTDIDDYIYFYNNERFQEKHNGRTPLEMRNKALLNLL